MHIERQVFYMHVEIQEIYNRPLLADRINGILKKDIGAAGVLENDKEEKAGKL